MDRLEAMTPSEIREVHNHYQSLQDTDESRVFIPLHFGEPDLGTPSFIVEAGCEALRNGVVFYENNSGRPDLKLALAAHYDLAPEHFVVTCGAMQAISLTMLALLAPGDRVINVTPSWPNFTEAARLAGAEVLEIPLRFDADARSFSLDFDRLREAAEDAHVRMLILNSPSNPTGWVIRADEMKNLYELCRERGILFVSDEIYDRILFDDRRFPSALGIADSLKDLIVINGFSKTYCMTGWRIGYLITDLARASQMARMQEFIVSHAPGAAQVAAVVALEKGDAFVTESVRRYRELRDLVARRLSGIDGIQLARTEGTFYAFFRVPQSADSVLFCRTLLEEAGVVLAPGRAFGAGGEGWVRLCFASEPNRLNEALDRLSDFLYM